MKILQVNCVYKKGSTGKITYDLHKGLINDGYESIVCYGRGLVNSETNVYKTCGEIYSKINHAISRIDGIIYGGCFVSTKKLIKIIKIENPDIVHLQCINGYFVNIYRLINWLKKNRINTVLTLHAEFMYTGNCGHAYDCNKWKTGCGNCSQLKQSTESHLIDATHYSWKKMNKAFRDFDDNLVVTSVSPWLMERAKQSVILGTKKHYIVMNGLDTEIFYPRNDLGKLRSEYCNGNYKIVLHVTADFSGDIKSPKGGYYIISLAQMMPDVTFMIVGKHSVLQDLPKNMVLLGNISEQNDLAKLYSLADASVITGRKETFSMPLAESLCCGTPVVGFFAGGPETIAIEKYCKFCDYGEIDALMKNLKLVLERKFERADISSEAHLLYGQHRMISDYEKIYEKLVTHSCGE